MYENKLSVEIANYIQKRAEAKLEKIDKEAEKARSKVSNSLALAELNAELEKKREKEIEKFEVNNWLTDASRRAKQISFVTHAIKFTHTDAKGTSLYTKLSQDTAVVDRLYLSTSSLQKLEIDVVGNAAALDVASFLQLEVEGIKLIDCIAENNPEPFSCFAENKVQLSGWMIGFNEVFASSKLSSHTLAKQIYFPVDEGVYHLLSPLYSSVLANELYQRITEVRYGEVAKSVRKAKRENKFSYEFTREYIGIAIQTFGGTKPQNVSQLNSSKGGKSFLLPSHPPVWRSLKQPPVNRKNSFWREYERRAWKTLGELKSFLKKVSAKENNKSIRDYRARLIDQLIDVLIFYAAEIKNLDSRYHGWSTHSKLPLAQQLWLDPHRQDPEFQQKRATKDWQKEIADHFGSWLNHKLKNDRLVLTDVEYKEWSKLLLRELSLLEE